MDEFINGLPEHLKPTAMALRRVVDANMRDGSSAIKWAHPTWSLGKRPICYLKSASRHVTFGFWRGASIHDPSGRLESSGSTMAHVKLRTPDDVDRNLFASWIRQAKELER